MAYRPCRFRTSTLGIFQCEKHLFQHSYPELYAELYEFCLENVPDNYCDCIEECDYPHKEAVSLG